MIIIVEYKAKKHSYVEDVCMCIVTRMIPQIKKKIG
jgi:hypothetical protein